MYTLYMLLLQQTTQQVSTSSPSVDIWLPVLSLIVTSIIAIIGIVIGSKFNGLVKDINEQLTKYKEDIDDTTNRLTEKWEKVIMNIVKSDASQDVKHGTLVNNISNLPRAIEEKINSIVTSIDKAIKNSSELNEKQREKFRDEYIDHIKEIKGELFQLKVGCDNSVKTLVESEKRFKADMDGAFKDIEKILEANSSVLNNIDILMNSIRSLHDLLLYVSSGNKVDLDPFYFNKETRKKYVNKD